MEGARRKGLALFLLFLTSTAFAEDSSARQAEDQFLAGDLLFRRGTGIAAEFARNFSTGERRFSHVGILAERDGDLVVVHSIYDQEAMRDGVVSDPIEVFLDGTSDWGLYRIGVSRDRRQSVADAALIILDRAVPFDNQFSLGSEDRLYCTELVWRIVNDVVGFEMIQSSTIANDAQVVAISDVYQNQQIRLLAESPDREP